jgi:putative hydrolase of the HAD superfamily
VNPALIVAAGVAATTTRSSASSRPFPTSSRCSRGSRAPACASGVITHGLTVKQAEKLVRLGLVPYLDPTAIFISDQIGISKPNPKLYCAALRELGLSPTR